MSPIAKMAKFMFDASITIVVLLCVIWGDDSHPPLHGLWAIRVLNIRIGEYFALHTRMQEGP